MTVQELYKVINGDYEDVMLRLPTENFIIRYLNNFLIDETYGRMMDAINKGDILMSFEYAHKFKGIAANMGFTELYHSVQALVDQLRSETEPADPRLVEKMSLCYYTVLNAIREFEKERI